MSGKYFLSKNVSENEWSNKWMHECLYDLDDAYTDYFSKLEIINVHTGGWLNVKGTVKATGDEIFGWWRADIDSPYLIYWKDYNYPFGDYIAHRG